MDVPFVGVGKVRHIGKFAKFRRRGSDDAFLPGFVVGLEQFDRSGNGKEIRYRVTIHRLDSRVTLHDADVEILPASADEFSGKLSGFVVRHSGLGLCKIVSERRVGKELRADLLSLTHRRVSEAVPVSELVFLYPDR